MQFIALGETLTNLTFIKIELSAMEGGESATWMPSSVGDLSHTPILSKRFEAPGE